MAGLLVAPCIALGRRGERRRQAREHGLFRAIDPVLRTFAAVLALVPHAGLRARLEQELVRASYFLGLSADELIALSILSAALGLAVGACAQACGGGPFLFIGCVVLGAALPLIAVRDRRRSRTRAITRRLPNALDLFALALNAGLNFGACVDLVAASFVDPSAPLCEELRFLQQDLATGSTRQHALLALGARNDAPSLHDLVRAVVQAERKGAPLAAVLEIQSEVSRNRRGVLAEEAAARAGVLLLMPVMLLMLALLLLLLAPLIIQGMQS